MSWRGRGWEKLGELEVTLTALGTQRRAGKGSVCRRRGGEGGMVNKEDICVLSWLWQPAVGCTEGQ